MAGLKYVIEVDDNGTAKLKKFGGAAKEADGNMGKMAVAAGAGALAIAALAKVTFTASVAANRFVSSQAQAIDTIGETARQLGLTIGQFTTWEFAAKRGGASSEELSAAVRKVAKSAEAGNEGWRRLGISVKDTDGNFKDANTLMMELSDAIARMPPGVERTSIAMDLMGKGGAKMITVMEGGSASIAALAEEGKGLGIVLDDKVRRSAEDAASGIDNFMAYLEGFKRQVASEAFDDLGASMKNMMETLSDPETRNGIATTLELIVNLSGKAASAMAKLGAAVGAAVGSIDNELLDEEEWAQARTDIWARAIKVVDAAKAGQVQNAAIYRSELARAMHDLEAYGAVGKKVRDEMMPKVNEYFGRQGIDAIDAKTGVRRGLPTGRKPQAGLPPKAKDKKKVKAADPFDDPSLEKFNRARENERLEWLADREAEARNLELEATRKQAADLGQLRQEMWLAQMSEQEQELYALKARYDAQLQLAKDDAVLRAQVDAEYAAARAETNKKFADEEAEQEKQRTALQQQELATRIGYMQDGLDAFKAIAGESKATMIGEAMINVYGGIAKALNTPFPLSLIAWAQVGAIGFNAIKQMKSTKMATGGDITGPSHAAGGVNRELEGGEAVIPRRTAQEWGGFRGIMRELGRTRSGGGVSVTLVNPIGNKDYLERVAVPTIREAAGRR